MIEGARKRCCAAMEREFARRCDRHPVRHECPDNVVGLFGDGRYGLTIHDGGSSMYEIAYCPWCGSDLHDDRG